MLWEGSGGWSFGGNNEHGDLTQPSNPPALVTSGGEFSNFGALCPSPDTPNFICGFYLGESDLVGGPGGGGLITLRASARLRQKNFTSNGFGRIVYGGARVTIVGLKFSSVAAPVSQVFFNFGLHGTRVETTNNGQVTVVGKGVAYLSADTQHFVQCFADVCEPIKVNVGSNGWDPGAPGGTAILVDLRTDATTSAPMGVVFDAEAVADFKDTLELLSIECKDANGATVPGVSLIITDNQGEPTYTFPNTPPSPTTTTTTVARRRRPPPPPLGGRHGDDHDAPGSVHRRRDVRLGRVPPGAAPRGGAHRGRWYGRIEARRQGVGRAAGGDGR